jgi:hypothetical protein
VDYEHKRISHIVQCRHGLLPRLEQTKRNCWRTIIETNQPTYQHGRRQITKFSQIICNNQSLQQRSQRVARINLVADGGMMATASTNPVWYPSRSPAVHYWQQRGDSLCALFYSEPGARSHARMRRICKLRQFRTTPRNPESALKVPMRGRFHWAEGSTGSQLWTHYDN